ncbi:MAG: MFS transporter [Cyanothece sp. SIO2G6]|nr:MFS transporter [Cyanothece sp. SIO2G6]
MKFFRDLDGAQRLNLSTLFLAGLLFWAGLASLLPILPLYIQEVGGEQWVGHVMAFFAVGLLASKAFLAKMTDVRGRKVVLLIGISAIAFTPVGYLLFPNIPALMGFRAIHGISISAFVTAYSALVIDMSPRQYRGEIIGYMSLVNPLGLAMGPAIGGFLLESAGFPPAILLSAGLGFLGLLCTTRIIESRSQSETKASASSSEQSKFWRNLVTPRVRVPAFVLLMVGFAFGTISTFIPLYIAQKSVSLNIGLFYTASAIMSFSSRLITGRASDRYGRGVFITVSVAIYALATFTLWHANSAQGFLLAAALQGCAAGTVIPMMAALMADRAEAHERGQLFGLCMVGFDVGIAIAGPTMQTLALRIGYGNIFGLVTALIVLGLMIFLTCSSKDLAHSIRFALGKSRDVYAVD